ncbi:prolactin-releasing peptide receptor-like [Babylonia areolata]|uniref:prolactin-releasing peptide receptor-like n=1 Tax=Babylonia areolata TaxID=304850 RepID=UPI003FD51C74
MSETSTIKQNVAAAGSGAGAEGVGGSMSMDAMTPFTLVMSTISLGPDEEGVGVGEAGEGGGGGGGGGGVGGELGDEEDESGTQVMRLTWLMSLFIFFYSLIFLLGTFGNLLVVIVVLRNKAMHTITNIFITNLAVSDICMCLLSVPFTPMSFFFNSWVFGKALCHVVPMTLCISVYVSTLTSTAISVDRYFVIVYPFKPRMKIYMCVLMIVAIWIISISISLPLGIYHEKEPVANTTAFLCTERWPKPQARQFFTVTSLVLQYIVPCTIITFCYSMVSRALKKRSKVKIGSGARSREREEQEIRRKKRTNKMLIAMVVIFMCCWMPLNVVLLVREYKESVENWYYFTFVFFIAHVIAMSSTIYNPFLYAWMNDNFKKEFKTILPCLFLGGRRSQGSSYYTQYTSVDAQPSVTVNRSPLKNGNDNNCNSSTDIATANNTANNAKETKAYYDADSEKVHLNLAEEQVTEDT